MNTFDPNKKEISGPFNAIRMEGEIDGNPKVIYLFMDVHMEPNAQTECANVYSQDFNRYLAKTFYDLNGSDRMYDFFLEIEPEWYKIDSRKRERVQNRGDTGGRRHNYIHQVMQLLRSALEYDFGRDRVSPSKIFQNVRLHYLDIRDALNLIMDEIGELPIRGSMDDIQFYPNIFVALDNARDLTIQLTSLYHELKSKPNSRSDMARSPFGKYIRKVLYGYKHSSIREVIVPKLDSYFDELRQLAGMIDAFTDLLQSYLRIVRTPSINFSYDNLIRPGIAPEQYSHYLSEIIKARADLEAKILYVGIGITDCYLLRRLLDKDYVTNAIVYTGGSHTTNYVIILAKYFNFQITHISYTSARSIFELNQTIRERLTKNIRITDLLIHSNRAQCCDITRFPKDFL